MRLVAKERGGSEREREKIPEELQGINKQSERSASLLTRPALCVHPRRMSERWTTSQDAK